MYGTVLAKKYVIYYLYSIVKNLWIYLKCSDFLPKKKKCVIFFIEKREKQNKRRKKSKNFEKNLRNDQREIWLFSEKRKTESGTTEKSRRTNPFGADIWCIK